MTYAKSEFQELALSVIPIAQMAGAAIMERYGSAAGIRYKTDKSPVTDADHAAEEIILKSLSKLTPDIPVIAEEQTAAGNIPETAPQFFLVDPLDGTKEFLKGNGEFTVNIGLISASRPILGLVYAPEKRDCYLTLNPGEAIRFRLDSDHNPKHDDHFDFQRLRGETPVEHVMTAIVSHSAARPQAQRFLENLGVTKRLQMGSSLKFGVLARGEADVYPRFGPTSEWDIAAGEAILLAAGGCVLTPDAKLIPYGKRDTGFLNSSFIAWRRYPNAKEFRV